MQVKNKVTIVTGATSGIGLATATLLHQKGAKVVLAARSKDKLATLSETLPGSFVVPTDMTHAQEVHALVEKTEAYFGSIDILINNAGQGYDALIENTDASIFRKIFDLDLVGPLAAMQAVIPIMRSQGKGVIVNISSGTALMFLPTMGAYSSLKRALVGISLTAREELKKDHISIGVVYPYSTETDFENNTIKGMDKFAWFQNAGDTGARPPADSAAYVAGKILEAIETERAETFAHDWMARQQKT